MLLGYSQFELFGTFLIICFCVSFSFLLLVFLFRSFSFTPASVRLDGVFSFRTQYRTFGIALADHPNWRCIFSASQVVTTEMVSLYNKESARILGVLSVDTWKHRLGHFQCGSFFFLFAFEWVFAWESPEIRPAFLGMILTTFGEVPK